MFSNFTHFKELVMREWVFEVEHLRVNQQKEKAVLRRYHSSWKCGLCNKIGSTKKIIVEHLHEVHNISEKF